MEKKDNRAAKEIGLRLKLLRVEQGLTSIEVCGRAGIRPPTLTAIEGGRYNTGIQQICNVAKVLGAHIEIIMD